MVLFLFAHSLSKLTSACNTDRDARTHDLAELSSDHVPGDVVPAKAEVVAVVWIDTYSQ